MTLKMARREALARLRMNRRLNNAEFAYSPRHETVGIRWSEDQSFKVFNVNHPCYKADDFISDWISVGKGEME